MSSAALRRLVLSIGVMVAMLAFVGTAQAAQPMVTSVGLPGNGLYGVGQSLDFDVRFDQPVDVDTSGGTPRIVLSVGSATYLSGSGTSYLLFRYTVQAGDSGPFGITVGALQLNGGTIENAGGESANLTLTGLGSTGNVRVDGVAPVIWSSAPAAGTYTTGQQLSTTVRATSL